MNRLPSSSSFQGVLDSIIRNYLLNELPPNGATRHQVAEKDLDQLQTNGLHVPSNPGPGQNGNEVNNNTQPHPGTSSAAANRQTFPSNTADHEYIKAIYQSFEKRGVFKELQTFLRHKLVSILQDELPSLHQKPVSASQKEGPNTVVHKLVDDFLRCHKLLYTLSVLASESDVKPQSTRVLYGKLSAKEAGDLLDEMGIKPHSRLNGQILKSYFEKENFSLLESIHYLGIWVDESSVQLDDLQKEAGKKRMGSSGGSSGESIILSKPLKDVRKASVVGIEERLLELEKKLEQEKEFKIREAIEKYKNKEHAKLREQLETKYKLQMVEKERTYFLENQKKINEINGEMQKEREHWLEIKLRQEQELCELKQQLNDMMHGSGDNNWKSRKLAFAAVKDKTCQVSLDSDSNPIPSVGVHKCSCGNISCKFPTAGASFTSSRPPVDPIEQDRLAFLQYRMEQQDEEIQTLRNQLLLSSQKPAIKPVKVVPFPSDHTPESEPQPDSSNPGSSRAPRSNDLDTFLSDSRLRVQKLDYAVDKVDEIVQELFAKRRSPLSKNLSSHLLSAARSKNNVNLSLGQLYSSLHSMANAPVLSPVNFPSAIPLVHQQIPEKQSAYCSSSPQPKSLFTATTTINRFPDPSIPSFQQLERPEIPTTTEHRPETPVERIFPVAYGQYTREKSAERQKGNSNEPSPSGTVTKSSREHKRSPNNNTVKEPVAIENLPEESLFHMAIRNIDDEQSISNDRPRLSFEEKAIRHGALSREKILSSDEGENSFSQSVSFSGSNSKKISKSMKSLGNGNERSSITAISKSKLSYTVDKVKASSSTVTFGTKVEPRQSLSTQQQLVMPIQNPTVSSSSSSSSSRRKSSSKVATQHGKPVQQENDESQQPQKQQPKHDDEEEDEQGSLSISVPKSGQSEDDNVEAEDFWQL